MLLLGLASPFSLPGGAMYGTFSQGTAALPSSATEEKTEFSKIFYSGDGRPDVDDPGVVHSDVRVCTHMRSLMVLAYRLVYSGLLQ